MINATTQKAFDDIMTTLVTHPTAEVLESYVFGSVACKACPREAVESMIDELVHSRLIESTVDAATFKPALRLTAAGKALAEANQTRLAFLRRL